MVWDHVDRVQFPAPRQPYITMIEVERKFRPAKEKIDRIVAYLRDHGSAPQVMRQVDKVFLYESDSFKQFKVGDPVIRIRSANNKTTLTYKRALGDGADRIEHELQVDSEKTAEALVYELGYLLATNVEKTRSEYELGALKVCLDDVVGLGMFLEIEAICNSDSEREQAQKEIMQLAGEMGLTESDIETKKYDQLIAESS